MPNERFVRAYPGPCRDDATADLYDGIQKLYALPLTTRVFVGHDYQSGGRPLRVESTIGVEREKNEDITARATRDEFVAMKRRDDATLNLPRLIFPSAPSSPHRSAAKRKNDATHAAMPRWTLDIRDKRPARFAASPFPLVPSQ